MPEVVYQPFGAARTVTGSRHVVRVGHRSLLLDCGLFQGPRREADEKNRHLPLPTDVEAVVLSHAHIDHSGALPSLIRDGFDGLVHATPATRDLCRALLADVAALNAADARYLNRRREDGAPEVRPLYDDADVQRALRRFSVHPLEEPFEPIPGVRATFREAGHILGSAGVLLEIAGGPRIYFTGDLGRRAYPILRDPSPLPSCDVVLTECTYGLRDHEPVEGAEETARAVIERAVKEGGKVFVPAFSVGRTQNLVYAYARLRSRGSLPDVPIYVDSPLAAKATQVFADHPECWDEEVRAFVQAGGDPFLPEGVHTVESVEASKALNDRRGPFVVVAGSGMCEGGRIVHHLLRGIEDERNTLLFVGYAAPGTLARRILDGEPRVRVLGQWRQIAARVARIDAFSAHADRSDLVRFLAPARAWDAAIHLVHGDAEVALAFAERLRAEGHRRVVVPEMHARYRLDAPVPAEAGGPPGRGGR